MAWKLTFFGVMEPGFTVKFCALLPFYMLRNCTHYINFLLLFSFYYS